MTGRVRFSKIEQLAVRTWLAKRSAKRKSRGAKTASIKGRRPATEERATATVIRFPTPEADNEDEPNPDVVEIKDQVRHASTVLEAGKQAAAVNLLKHIVGS